ncbi:gamma-thionin [Artemisia annua]|uniref:Gamma-thionin n=1 Tax=Artemisia annua TaxID=35608 RepID=A0A2U1LMI4_ARTAN|nr:gamma-thionin [Artemisia annua]
MKKGNCSGDVVDRSAMETEFPSAASSLSNMVNSINEPRGMTHSSGGRAVNIESLGPNETSTSANHNSSVIKQPTPSCGPEVNITSGSVTSNDVVSEPAATKQVEPISLASLITNDIDSNGKDMVASKKVKNNLCSRRSKTWSGFCGFSKNCDRQCRNWEKAAHGACHHQGLGMACFCYFNC